MNYSDEMNKEGYKLLSEYQNARTKLKYECPNGHIGEMLPKNWKRGSRCRQCFAERQKNRELRTPNPFRNEATRKHNISRLGEFIKNIGVLSGIDAKKVNIGENPDILIAFRVLNKYNDESLTVHVFDGNYKERESWTVADNCFPMWIYNDIEMDLEYLMKELDSMNIIKLD